MKMGGFSPVSAWLCKERTKAMLPRVSKGLRVAALALALLLVLGACAPAASPAAPLAVTDMLGREVNVPQKVERVVSLTPTNTEIVHALGLGERLVAVDDHSDYPADLGDVARIGSYAQINVEAVVALGADLVLAGDKLQQESIDQLTQLGMCVVATEGSGFAAAMDSIDLVAKVLGAGDDAKQAIADMQARMDAVLAKTNALADAQRPAVYWAVSFGEYGDYTVGQGSFVTELIELAGGRSISADIEVPWPMYSVEQIVAANPEYIFIPMDEAFGAAFLTTEPYASLEAVQNGNVVFLDAGAASRPGPRLVDILEQVHETLHPGA